MTRRGLPHAALCAVFVLLAGAFHLIASAPAGARGAYSIALYLALALVMFGVWAAGLRDKSTQHWLAVLAGMAAILVVAPISVAGVHDVQRYLWDGAVFGAGLDPYRLAPSAPEVSELRTLWPTPAEHVGYTTIYPPGAVFLFGLAAQVGPVWAHWLWKLLVALAALGIVWFGARTLDRLNLSRHVPLLALSPLLIMEAAVGAHLDVFAALAVAAGLYLVVRDKPIGAGVAFGIGALIKFLPALVLLPVAIWLGGRAARRVLASSTVVVGLGYLVAFLWGLHPLGSLPVFFEKWRFGSPGFSIVAALLGDSRALYVAPALVGLALVVVARMARDRWKTSVAFVMAIPLLVSPVVFPWYLVPLVPAVAIAPSGFMLAWLTTMPLTHEVVDRFETAGIWDPASWPLWVIGLSWIVGAIIDLTHRRQRFQRAIAHGVATPRISVIVPVLNEEARIGRQLEALTAMSDLHEVIVVDGGSTDRTVEIARSFPSARALRAQTGRAVQMNDGAAVATGDVLLFLHADVSLPDDAARWISEALADSQVVAGAFRTWTVPDSAQRSWLSPLLHLADVRSRYSSLPYGDQAVFVRAETFRIQGGFPGVPLMEDLALSHLLRRAGRIRIVPATVRVSGRRFLARPIYYTLLVNLFPLLYRLGMPPRVLASFYGHPR